MPINSRSKGARNERNLAKAFEEWTGRKFSKTPASGGLNWRTTNVAGDIVCTKEGHYFPFCIEGKSYAKIDFSHLLNPKIKNCDILIFWKQAKRDAARVGKIPILMMRYNDLPKNYWFIVIGNSFFDEIKGYYNPEWPIMRFHSITRDLVIMNSPDFFKMPYKEIKLLAKKYIKANVTRR